MEYVVKLRSNKTYLSPLSPLSFTFYHHKSVIRQIVCLKIRIRVRDYKTSHSFEKQFPLHTYDQGLLSSLSAFLEISVRILVVIPVHAINKLRCDFRYSTNQKKTKSNSEKLTLVDFLSRRSVGRSCFVTNVITTPSHKMQINYRYKELQYMHKLTMLILNSAV